MIRVKKWTVKKTVCSYAVIIFMNSFIWIHFFDALHVFTQLQNREINNATYCNNNQHLNYPMNEETVFHHHSKQNQFLMLSTIFCYYYCCTFSFFQMVVFFPSKHIKVKFKVVKIILIIDIEGKVCSHHTV